VVEAGDDLKPVLRARLGEVAEQKYPKNPSLVSPLSMPKYGNVLQAAIWALVSWGI